MKIVVIGGSGLIGSKLVDRLGAQGHEAVPASPKTGVNTLTGEGVADALTGAEVVVDVSNSPSFEDAAVLEFFETSTRTLLAAASDAGVNHYVALSIVGCDRIPDSGYMRAKVAQEKLIVASGLPYSVVHATQFFEFLKGIVDTATDGDTVHLAPVLIQPMAADDVAAAVAEVALGAPTNSVVEVAGPEQFRLDELGRSLLADQQDRRSVVADPDARYFGAKLGERSLVPADGARLAGTALDDWRVRAGRGH
ncbi:SDR family oxidoreductase [Micromonospora arida]|uniref:SDR family oxidoreductase n=1 Tax=Micromonospora arida TaxID=2203715 RepID=UPI0033AC9512